ncbi:MAG: shikimate kinase [Firmicutes bacterium]|nr:shikimate kinase [Bacillota bacterium]
MSEWKVGEPRFARFKPPIVLMGMMGSGKTTVGRVLAHELGWGFEDLDAAIVRRTGLEIAEIFSRYGEEGFREREHRYLKEMLLSSTPLVLALGGGTVVLPENRALLHETAVVWLKGSLPLLYSRVADDAGRPLAGAGWEVFEMRYRQREPWFQSLAWAIEDVDGRSCEEIAQNIISIWQNGVRE